MVVGENGRERGWVKIGFKDWGLIVVSFLNEVFREEECEKGVVE